MNQDTVINLATQAMTLAMKVAGPLLLVGLVVGLVVSIFQAVTQIQEQSLTPDPEDHRRRGGRRRARPVDARPARRLHDRPVHVDPDAGRLMNTARQATARGDHPTSHGFILVLARVTPLFLLAPLFSSAMIPPRVRGVIAVGIAIGLTPIALQGQHVPADPLALAGLVVAGHARRLRLRLLPRDPVRRHRNRRGVRRRRCRASPTGT